MQILTSAILAFAAASLAVAAPILDIPTFEYPFGSSDVSVVRTDDVRYIVGSGPDGPIYDAYINVLVAVRNKGYDKVVGVRYTTASWLINNKETNGSYVAPLSNGFELWNVSISRGQKPENFFKLIEVEIAAFAVYNTKTSSQNDTDRVWDPSNPYYTVLKATPSNPIGATTQFSIFYRDNSLFIGYARTWTLAEKDSVTIRWTVNDWASYTDTPLTLIGRKNLWCWAIENVNVSSVQFALKYDRADGKTFWADNDGSNYLVESETISL